MISEKDKISIISIADKYNVSKILLFGSSAKPGIVGNDIDLAVEGVKDSEFFKFYGEVMFAVSKPVDIIDLSNDNMFTELVQRDGVVIYG